MTPIDDHETGALPDDPTITAHLTWIRERGVSANTVLSYRTGLRDLYHHARRPLLGLLPDDLQAWRGDAGRRLGSGTIRGYITGIHSFYRWALRNGLIAVDPSRDLDLPRAPRRLPRPLPDADVELALSTADARVAACIGLGRFAGLRCCEIARLSREEVTFGPDAHLRVVEGKGSHERVVDIAPRLERILRALPGPWCGPVIPRADGRRDHNQPWRISQLINRHFDTLGITGRAHALRHSFGTAMYAASKDLRATGEALGHAPGAPVTALYTQVTRDTVRAAVLAAAEMRVS